MKHFLYGGGWKKFEPLWNFIIKTRNLNNMLPILESILSKVEDKKTKFSCENTPPFMEELKPSTTTNINLNI
jgi:hypothetical protein